MSVKVTACFVLLGFLGSHVSAQEYRIVFLKNTLGNWQPWHMTSAGHDCRQLIDSKWDKRCLRSGGVGTLLYRNNEGELFSSTLQTPTQSEQLLSGVEVVKDYDYHPDYGYLVSTYASNAKDNLRIWWYSQDGARKRLMVPNPHLNEMPRWFPNGAAFLFARRHSGASSIYQVELSDGRQAPVFANSVISMTQPVLSPCGKKLVFCADGNEGRYADLWISDPEEKTVKKLHSGKGMETDPAWSPDGEWVIFSTWDEQSFRIARIKHDGSEYELLSPEGDDCRDPVCILIQGGKK